MGRMAALSEWLDGGNQRVVDAGCWRYDRGHRGRESGGAIEAQLLGTCHGGRR
jgi:hypothetical protein